MPAFSSVTATDAQLIPLVDFVRGRVSPDLTASDATFRRMVRKGLLPRRIDTSGKLVFTAEEVRFALHPPKTFDTESSIRAWAQAKAASAPPMSPEQRDLLVSAFSSALSRKVVA